MFYSRNNMHIVQVFSSCARVIEVDKRWRGSGENFCEEIFSTPTHGFLIIFRCPLPICKIFSGEESPDVPPLLLWLFILIFYSQWSFYLHAADSWKQPRDVCWHCWGNPPLHFSRAAREGGVEFIRGYQEGGLKFFPERGPKFPNPGNKRPLPKS